MWQNTFNEELEKIAIGFSKQLLVNVRRLKGVNAASGAIAGGVVGAIGAPSTNPETGQTPSPVPSMLAGAAVGALGGGLAGKAQKALRATSNMNAFGTNAGKQVTMLGKRMQKLETAGTAPAAQAAPTIGQAATGRTSMFGRIFKKSPKISDATPVDEGSFKVMTKNDLANNATSASLAKQDALMTKNRLRDQGNAIRNMPTTQRTSGERWKLSLINKKMKEST